MDNKEGILPEKILLAVDASEHALHATKFLSQMDLPKQSEIHIIAVLIPRLAQHHVVLESALEQSQTLISKKNVSIVTKLLSGYPGEQLTLYAEQFKPDLIVMGAKGLRSTLGILLGGVAHQVVQSVACPVLVVRKEKYGLNRVLLAVDGSDFTWFATKYLTKSTIFMKSDIHVVYTMPEPVSEEVLLSTWPVGMDGVPIIPAEIVEDTLREQEAKEKEQGETVLRKVGDMLKAANLSTKLVLKKGDAATEVIRYGKELECDLIIVGSRGMGGLKGLFLGNVATKILHYAPCSVLVMKK